MTTPSAQAQAPRRLRRLAHIQVSTPTMSRTRPPVVLLGPVTTSSRPRADTAARGSRPQTQPAGPGARPLPRRWRPVRKNTAQPGTAPGSPDPASHTTPSNLATIAGSPSGDPGYLPAQADALAVARYPRLSHYPASAGVGGRGLDPDGASRQPPRGHRQLVLPKPPISGPRADGRC